MILTLNIGSSSLKYALYEGKTIKEKGKIEDIRDKIPSHSHAVNQLLSKITKPTAIGHRIVYGGNVFIKPTLITEEVIATLEKMIPFSPLHLPAELEVVKTLSEKGFTQIACFDTSFHRAMPKLHQHFPLPSSLWEEGVQRYGFHGLSYEYITFHLKERVKGKKIIIAHLGNGASMVALDNGRPIETTMGFTPAGGIMMGTRSGDLDPGILTYLIREKGYGAKELDQLINSQSGLLGVSNLTSDMKMLLELRKKEKKADEAISLFCYSARKAIGALTGALGGLDLLIFTGGIGEQAQPIREEICRGLEFLDIQKKIEVIPTDENAMIAQHVKAFLS